jgi:hypothetical protein
MSQEVSAFLRAKGLNNAAYPAQQSWNCVFGCLSQMSLQFTEGHLDRVEVELHDLRHGFASKTLLSWYRAGEDAERRLPILSAYLGHVHWSDTFWYLSALPELMHEAMSRLERRWEDRP